jgi:hypothetical protein
MALMSLVSRLRSLALTFHENSRRLQRIQEALGRIEARQVALDANASFNDAEFRVFSQWGEDGLIQYLIRRVPVPNKIFVEFGVENYLEANTRFLVLNDRWSGLVMDASAENIEFIRRDPISWASHLNSVSAFITRENINDLLQSNNICGDIGLLSVDIDGNDYWVWEAIDCISPRIVICEYNALFGPVARVTTPYDPAFTRRKAHFSGVFYGTSIAALEALGRLKGYILVGGNSAGNNVFFVRDDVAGALKPVRAAEAYRRPRFREFQNEQGQLTYYDMDAQLRSIGELEVFDLDRQACVRVRDTVGTKATNA